ncbi:MAG: Mut7-C ubiquitin/RNAse domain-containing protein [Bacteroidales bacterium]|nr:Mut7-C ubiquitin/RNAse domain-containing protein [Bacteroidales bacterium]
MNKVEFRFYEELNDFVPKSKKRTWFIYNFKGKPTVKDAIEAIGIPHVEVDLILVNNISVPFSYKLKNNDRISVYPVFESIDITSVTQLRAKPLRKIKFILDVHFGKLSKYLRLLGFDCFYINDIDDNEIINIAIKEKRIILTRDKGLLKNMNVTHGYWVRSQDSIEQLKEIVKRFHLDSLIKPFYRCIVCNGIIEKASKEKIISELQPNTIKYYDDFYKCSLCGKIYWKGSHYEKMKQFVDKIINLPEF